MDREKTHPLVLQSSFIKGEESPPEKRDNDWPQNTKRKFKTLASALRYKSGAVGQEQ